MFQGVRLGVKWMTFIMVPLLVIGLFVGLGHKADWRFTGISRLLAAPDFGWETLEVLGSLLGGYLVSCLWGSLVGLLVCSFAYLVRKAARKRRE